MLKDGINEIRIESYDDLVNIICGKHKKNKIDLRESFVFRGLSDVKYELIPSSGSVRFGTDFLIFGS